MDPTGTRWRGRGWGRGAVAVAFLAVLTGMLLPRSAVAAAEGDQLWVMTALQGGFGFVDPRLDRIKGYLELQGRWRSFETLETVFLPRAALGYAITPRLTVFAGFAQVEFDLPRRRTVHELRPYQQLTWNLPVSPVTLQSRTRLEQRIHQENLGWRMRELVKAAIPIPGSERVYLAAYDELFVELDDTTWGQRRGVRQNRFFVGPGFRLDPDRHVALEVGYLNQWIDRKRHDRVNHVSSLNLLLAY